MFRKNNLSGINIKCLIYIKKHTLRYDLLLKLCHNVCKISPNVGDNYTAKIHTGIAGSVKPSNYPLGWIIAKEELQGV